MVRILVIVTKPVERPNRRYCNSKDEWYGCWWGNTSVIGGVSPGDYNVSLFLVGPNGRRKDIIHVRNEYGEGTEVSERTNPHQDCKGQDYLLLRKANYLSKFLKRDRWEKRNNKNGIVLIRTKGNAKKDDVRIKRAKEVVRESYIDARMIFHIDPLNLENVESNREKNSYTIPMGKDYNERWEYLTQLRYGGVQLDGNRYAPTRKEAFNQVWQSTTSE